MTSPSRVGGSALRTTDVPSLSTDGSARPLIARELGVARTEHPGTVDGDADRYDVVPIGVEVAQDASGGNTGH